MGTTVQSERERRLELARKAFKDFYAQCFWSSDPNLVVEEQHIPFIVRNRTSIARSFGGADRKPRSNGSMTAHSDFFPSNGILNWAGGSISGMLQRIKCWPSSVAKRSVTISIVSTCMNTICTLGRSPG